MSETGMKRSTSRLVADLLHWAVPYEQALAEFRREYFRQLLSQVKGNQTKAAAALGIHRNSLRRQLNELGISSPRAYRRTVGSIT